MKVMSYNVYGFCGLSSDPEMQAQNKETLVEFLVKSGCDIICLQEAYTDGLSDSLQEALYKVYPYHQSNTREGQGNYVTILSKYQIVRSDSIRYNSKGNLSMAYTLQTPSGPLTVVNNHLESNSLSIEEKERFRTMMQGEMNRSEMRDESKSMFAKLTEAALKRSAQADSVADFLELQQDMPVILCGDFNDNPVSYTHYRIARNLTDCFVEAGNGCGWSYQHNAMRVRIDNIMCSYHFKPVKTKVLTDITLSDHNPIVSWMEFKADKAKGK